MGKERSAERDSCPGFTEPGSFMSFRADEKILKHMNEVGMNRGSRRKLSSPESFRLQYGIMMIFISYPTQLGSPACSIH